MTKGSNEALIEYLSFRNVLSGLTGKPLQLSAALKLEMNYCIKRFIQYIRNVSSRMYDLVSFFLAPLSHPSPPKRKLSEKQPKRHALVV